MNRHALTCCCIALCLVLAGLPATASLPVAADAMQPMPCDGQEHRQAHDHECGRGCQSAPELPGAEPDWGPACSRATGPELPDFITLPPAWRDAEPPRVTAGSPVAPRGPPLIKRDSPVTRSDRLLD
jgi:hypothetical protein